MTFTDRLVLREASDALGERLPTDFPGAAISITAGSSALRFLMPKRLTDGTVRLWIGRLDGTPIEIIPVEIIAATNIGLPIIQWKQLRAATVLTNGLLQIDDNDASSQSTRFYRAIQQP
jgi:hypothetical protein